MNGVYANYSTVTSATRLEHEREIRHTIDSFRLNLLPLLRSEGVPLEQADVLELGAGWGKNLFALRQLGARTIRGVDISREQVELGQRLGLPTLELLSPGRAISDQLGEVEFDLVLAMDVLEHLTVPQLEEFAGAIRRALRPGGLAVVQVPNDLAPLNPLRAGDITHVRAFTGDSLAQFFRLCHLEPVRIQGMPLPGRGLVFHCRAVLVRFVLGPLIAAVARILYGRSDPYGIHTPNILGIGRRRGND